MRWLLGEEIKGEKDALSRPKRTGEESEEEIAGILSPDFGSHLT